MIADATQSERRINTASVLVERNLRRGSHERKIRLPRADLVKARADPRVRPLLLAVLAASPASKSTSGRGQGCARLRRPPAARRLPRAFRVGHSRTALAS